LRRESLVNAFVLIDSNVPPQKIDLEFCNWLGENGVPFVIVFTKTDRKKARGGENVAAFKKELLVHWESLPPIFLTSAVNGIGREEIISFLENTLQSVDWAFESA
jgi:GTP-binding protein